MYFPSLKTSHNGVCGQYIDICIQYLRRVMGISSKNIFAALDRHNAPLVKYPVSMFDL